MYGSFSKVANGNITMSRFVKLDSTNEGRAVQAGANDDPFGISQPYPRLQSLLDDGFCAIAGEQFNIYGPGDDQCLLEIGGTVTYGDRLKSDVDGKGVTATTDKDKSGAIALQSGSAGDLIKVKPMRFDVSV